MSLVKHLLFKIGLFISPLATYAKDSDLSPASYKIAKSFVADVCEAKEDGLSIKSAFDLASSNLLGNYFKSGAIWNAFSSIDWDTVQTADNPEGITEEDSETREVKDVQKDFVYSKLQKNCLNAKELKQFKIAFEAEYG